MLLLLLLVGLLLLLLLLYEHCILSYRPTRPDLTTTSLLSKVSPQVTVAARRPPPYAGTPLHVRLQPSSGEHCRRRSQETVRQADGLTLDSQCDDCYVTNAKRLLLQAAWSCSTRRRPVNNQLLILLSTALRHTAIEKRSARGKGPATTAAAYPSRFLPIDAVNMWRKPTTDVQAFHSAATLLPNWP